MPDPGGLVRKMRRNASPGARAGSGCCGAGGGRGALLRASGRRRSRQAGAVSWTEGLVEQVEEISPLTGATMRPSVR
jgi:DNA polymerase-3 subunit gamma/tau